MNASLPRTLLIVALATFLAFGTATNAHAGTKAKTGVSKWHAPKFLPKVKFKADGKLSMTEARVNLRALVTFAGKTHSISIFSMGILKTKASVKIRRKIGKLRVSLKVSWYGKRMIKITGTARYLKIKVPVPPIKIHF